MMATCGWKVLTICFSQRLRKAQHAETINFRLFRHGDFKSETDTGDFAEGLVKCEVECAKAFDILVQYCPVLLGQRFVQSLSAARIAKLGREAQYLPLDGGADEA